MPSNYTMKKFASRPQQIFQIHQVHPSTSSMMSHKTSIYGIMASTIFVIIHIEQVPFVMFKKLGIGTYLPPHTLTIGKLST